VMVPRGGIEPPTP